MDQENTYDYNSGFDFFPEFGGNDDDFGVYEIKTNKIKQGKSGK